MGAPIASTVTSNIGQELDLLATVPLTKNFNVQAGYFWFFYGDAINGGAAARPDARQFYLQTTWQF